MKDRLGTTDWLTNSIQEYSNGKMINLLKEDSGEITLNGKKIDASEDVHKAIGLILKALNDKR